MVIIVKIPKFYRPNGEMAKFIGPFSSWEEAKQWVSETFFDYEQHVFSYFRVDKP